MVKRKSRQVKRSAPTFRSMQRSLKNNRRINKYWLYFLNLLIVAIFAVGAYKIFFEYRWKIGLFIIVLGLIILLIMKIYYKLRR